MQSSSVAPARCSLESSLSCHQLIRSRFLTTARHGGVEGKAPGKRGLQRLIDLVCEFCALIGMVISVPKTKVLIFNTGFPGPLQWICEGEQLQIVSEFKYLGIIFSALYGMAPAFPKLKKNMFAAWALLKRQYGRLQCLTSVGLMFRVYDICVPPTAAYGCEIWGFQQFPQHFSTLRHELVTCHLQILKEITGVRGSTSTDTLSAELGLKSLQHWLWRAVKFWSNLADKPVGTIYREIALESCRAAVGSSQFNWAWSMFKSVRATGYALSIRADDMDIIDVTALRRHLTQQRDSVWDGLDICPRTCPSHKSRCCTYVGWFARPVHRHARSLLDIPVSASCMKGLLRFRMGCHRLPRDEGSWARPAVPRLERICRLCAVVRDGCCGR